MCPDWCTAKMYFHISVITYLIRSGGFLFFSFIFKQMNALICIYIISRQPRVFFPYAHGAHSSNKCRGTGDPLLLYSFFWVLNFMQKIWFLLQLGRHQKKANLLKVPSKRNTVHSVFVSLCYYPGVIDFFNCSFVQGWSELFANNFEFFTVVCCGLCIFFSYYMLVEEYRLNLVWDLTPQKSQLQIWE